MIIDKIEILNFKSIENITIDLGGYGNKDISSKTMILVGINESGKSNILEAINSVNHLMRDYEYESTYYKSGDKDRYGYCTVNYFMRIDQSFEKYINEFCKKYMIPPNLQLELNINNFEKVYRDISLDEDGDSDDSLYVKLNKTINWHHYIIETDEYDDDKISIKQLNVFQDTGSKPITKEDVIKSLKANQVLLTQEYFEDIFRRAIQKQFYEEFPNIIYWKSSPEHLIDKEISLSEFKDDTGISLPLKNIFRIYGANDDESINKIILRALKSEEFKSELEDSLSESITKYINRIWKEHKINIRVKFDNDKCKVHVEDLSVKFKYYNMKNRSDGFKQFLSLILSISAENETNLLKNNIILLDEPEVHLHPSGIRYLRDEILKIGKENSVIVATHSHYLIDINTPERHWIIQKERKTDINQLTETTNFSDDEVISKAFGINLIKELIPNNIIIVEGFCDKIIINHIISLMSKEMRYVIKGAGGGNKVYSTASLFNDEDLKAFVIIDADDEGAKAKADIIKHLKPSFSSKNVLTLKDIIADLPNGSTLEYLYPINFINQLLSQKLGKEVNLNTDQPIIQQLKIIDQSYSGSNNKEKVEKLKIEMSELFISHYKSKQSIGEASRLFKLGEFIISNIKS